jgi:hypothetical protein
VQLTDHKWLTSTISVQLMLGIADGKNFRFIVSKPQWQMIAYRCLQTSGFLCVLCELCAKPH